MHAPGFALVFLTDQALAESEHEGAVQTFSTTAVTKLSNTATVEPSVLQTSNGLSGKDLKLGSTSRGSSSSAVRVRGLVPWFDWYIGCLSIVVTCACVGNIW